VSGQDYSASSAYSAVEFSGRNIPDLAETSCLQIKRMFALRSTELAKPCAIDEVSYLSGSVVGKECKSVHRCSLRSFNQTERHNHSRFHKYYWSVNELVE
jgi:2-keto-3-deoxy-galactonokinase